MSKTTISYLKKQFSIGLIISFFVEMFIIIMLSLFTNKNYFSFSFIFVKNFILIYLLTMPLIFLNTINTLLYRSKNKILFYLSIFFTVIISILILLIYLILLPFIEGFSFN